MKQKKHENKTGEVAGEVNDKVADGAMKDISAADTAENVAAVNADDSVSAGKKPEERKGTSLFVYLLTYLFRLGIGAVFIFSGYVKAIDPWGTIYKFKEYFAAMGIGCSDSQMVVLAFALFSLEFAAGVALVTGSYRKWAPRLGLFFMLLMLPLTLWLAIAEPVADCGCFGDAVILTNWQTFWKNVAITLALVWLCFFNGRIRCIIIPTLQVWSICLTLAFVIFIGFIGYASQPMVDYRPYKVGGSLLPEEEEELDYQSVWSDGKTQITLPADSIPEGEQWEFVKRLETSPAKKSKGLVIYDGQEDVTEDVILPEGKQVIMLFPDISDVSYANFYKLNSLQAFSSEHGIDMMAVAAGDSLQVADFIDVSLAEYPIYTAEDTAIKEVARGNPAMVYLEDGKVVWKLAFSSVATEDFMDGNTKDLRQYTPRPGELLRDAWLTYILLMLAFIVLSHIPMAVRIINRKLRMPGKRTAVGVLAFGLICSLCSCSDKDEPGPAPASENLTVLVYMVASNNLYENSINDMKEILEAVRNCSASELNVLVYQVESTSAPKLIYVQKNGSQAPVLRTLRTYANNQESLTPARISEVIAEVKEFAPADRYGLFLWSHASNWMPALNPVPGTPSYAARNDDYKGPSYSFGDDNNLSINVPALSACIPDHAFEFIWMDCCEMGSVEVAYQFRNKCDYYIAYPSDILAAGAPYGQVLPQLAKGDITGAAKLTFDFYAQNENPSDHHCSIGVTRTSSLEAVADVCRQAGNSQPIIGTIGLNAYGRFQNVTFYDACQSFSNMNPDLEVSLKQAFDNALIYKDVTPRLFLYSPNPKNYCGLSCTLPQSLLTDSQKNLFHELDWYKKVFAQ